jgi:cytidylate kinase
VKAYFHARLDNELLYDLAVNTDRISKDDTVAVIAAITQRFFSTL